jgi:hypothetical protein
LGTLSSSFIIFFLALYLILILGLGVSYHGLAQHRIALAHLSWPIPILGYLGIILSNVSAAFVNLKGIPRLISMINEDGAVPFFRFLATPHSASSIPNAPTPIVSVRSSTSLSLLHQTRYLNPRKILFTFIFTAIPCLAGDLNYVAQFVAVPTLLVFVALNISCFLMAFIKAPGFRPQWRFFR